MSVPSIATAPFSMMRPAASTVTTVPPVTTRSTSRGRVLSGHGNHRRQGDGGHGGEPGAHRRDFSSISIVSLHMIDHPLAHDALMELRDVGTAPPAFRRAATRISLLLAAEALRALPTVVTTVTTPLGPADGRVVRTDVVVVPVLRAGLSMLDAVLQLVPSARVGHIGLQRDETTAVASRYYSKLPPDIGDSHVLMVDPMLATGGSSAAAIDLVKAAGARRISLVCVISAPEGVALLQERHPDVADLHACRRSRTQCAQVHRAGAGGLRGSTVRDVVRARAAGSGVSGLWAFGFGPSSPVFAFPCSMFS